MRWPWVRRAKAAEQLREARRERDRERADPERLMYELRKFGIVDYDERQMKRDFRFVFFQDVQGKRVLYQILYWAGLYSIGPEDKDALNRREGARELAIRILAALNAELPAPQPMIQQESEDE